MVRTRRASEAWAGGRSRARDRQPHEFLYALRHHWGRTVPKPGSRCWRRCWNTRARYDARTTATLRSRLLRPKPDCDLGTVVIGRRAGILSLRLWLLKLFAAGLF